MKKPIFCPGYTVIAQLSDDPHVSYLQLVGTHHRFRVSQQDTFTRTTYSLQIFRYNCWNYLEEGVSRERIEQALAEWRATNRLAAENPKTCACGSWSQQDCLCPEECAVCDRKLHKCTCLK